MTLGNRTSQKHKLTSPHQDTSSYYLLIINGASKATEGRNLYNLGAFSVCLCTWRPKVNVSSSVSPPYFLRQSLSGAYQFSYAGQQAPEIMELATMHSFFMWRTESQI